MKLCGQKRDLFPEARLSLLFGRLLEMHGAHTLGRLAAHRIKIDSADHHQIESPLPAM